MCTKAVLSCAFHTLIHTCEHNEKYKLAEFESTQHYVTCKPTTP